MKLSRFCHFYRLDNNWILFHSLNFNLFRISEHDAGLIFDRDSALLAENRHNSHIYKQLIDYKIIIAQDDDDHLLEASRNLIKKPYISTAYFFITNNCNLACRYCFEKQSEPGFFRKESMTREVAMQGLRFFSGLTKLQPERFNEKKTIIFYGGEPLMNKDILKYAINSIRQFITEGKLPPNTRAIIVTNGTLINDDDITFFREHDVTLTFSIDGDEEATENRVFPGGRPAFREIAAAYEKCREAGLDLNVACTLTPSTLSRMQKSLDCFINKLKIKNIGFNVLLDNGLIDIPDGYDEAAADFVAEAGKILEKHSITENRNVRRRQVFNMRKPCIFDCNAQGGRQIAIAPGGEVGICHEHIADRQHFTGTIYQDFDPQKDSVYMEWSKRSPLYMKKCLDCPALGTCGGGCVINTERLTGSIWEPDPRFCKQTLKLLEMMVLQRGCLKT